MDFPSIQDRSFLSENFDIDKHTVVELDSKCWTKQKTIDINIKIKQNNNVIPGRSTTHFECNSEMKTN